MMMDSANPGATNTPPILVSSRVTDGSDFIVIFGCMVYRTAGAVRHTSFCYFYNAKVTPDNIMDICTVGNAAD